MRRAAIVAISLTGALSCADPSLAPVTDSSAGAPVALLDRGISFADLGPGDRIVVHHSSKGCFHEFALRLVISGEANGVELTGDVLSTNAVAPPVIPRRALRQGELAALDRLLALYRGGTKQWCTNTDTVRLSAFSGGRLVREERYVDTSCVWFEQPGVLTFPAVALTARN